MIQSPRLTCVAFELAPGTIQLDWLDGEGVPDCLKLDGAEAAQLMEQHRAAKTDRERFLLIRSTIEAKAVR